MAKKNESLEEREELLSTIIHDLKNPIGAIFGYADVLLETELCAGLSPRQQEILTRVRQTALRSVEMVRNYQYLSKLPDDAPKRDSYSALNNATTTIISSVWAMSTSGPSLKFTPSKDEIHVSMETIDLERVLANLIVNAIKYSTRDAIISIRTNRVPKAPPIPTSADATSDIQHCAIFEITNSAPVIPEEERERIFERRVRGRNSQHLGGSGLGLYIVKRILHENNGSIELISDGIVGTRFTVTLPLATQAAPAKSGDHKRTSSNTAAKST